MSLTHGTVAERIALFQRVAFVAEVPKQLKSLSGWNKSHRIPDQANNKAQDFVAGLSTTELKQDLDSIYAALKQAFGFKRRDLDASESEGGAGAIITPYFTYSISVSLNPADPSELIWKKTVDNIKEPAEVVSEAFAEVFDNVFHTLQFSLPTSVDIDDFIDALEAADIGNLELTHDRDATYCELRFDDTPGAVRVSADTLSIVQKHPAKIGTLLQSLKAMQALVQQHNVPLIWASK